MIKAIQPLSIFKMLPVTERPWTEWPAGTRAGTSKTNVYFVTNGFIRNAWMLKYDRWYEQIEHYKQLIDDNETFGAQNVGDSELGSAVMMMWSNSIQCWKSRDRDRFGRFYYYFIFSDLVDFIIILFPVILPISRMMVTSVHVFNSNYTSSSSPSLSSTFPPAGPILQDPVQPWTSTNLPPPPPSLKPRVGLAGLSSSETEYKIMFQVLGEPRPEKGEAIGHREEKYIFLKSGLKKYYFFVYKWISMAFHFLTFYWILGFLRPIFKY